MESPQVDMRSSSELEPDVPLMQLPRSPFEFRPRRREMMGLWFLIFNILFFLSSVVVLVHGLRLKTASRETCPTDWSPLLGYFASTVKVRFDGSFHRDSPFKGPPSKEVDRKWAEITPLAAMSIPEDVYSNLNASKHAVKVPMEAGGGRQALFEVVHQIHCVKSLWMATYPEYYAEEHKYSQEHPEAWHEHMDHCADMLRQKLMCDADAGLVTYNWIKHHYAPHPNFNVQHTCRDFGRLLEKAKELRIDGRLFPQGYIARPSTGPVVEFDVAPFDPAADD